MKAAQILLLIFFLAACKSKPEKEVKKEEIYYTCSMDPQVKQSTPGKCPICGMALVEASKLKPNGNDEIILTEQQVLLSNISVDTIHNGMMGGQLILTATVNFDQAKISAISSRIMGR